MKLWICAALAVLALSSCNTMIGLGRDFRQLGEGLENTANGDSWNSSGDEEPLPTY